MRITVGAAMPPAQNPLTRNEFMRRTGIMRHYTLDIFPANPENPMIRYSVGWRHDYGYKKRMRN